MEPVRDATSDFTLSDVAGLLSLARSTDESRGKAGRPLLPDTTLSPDSVSSLLFLYAALPRPLSAVCLNQDGSLAPSDAAIWSRDGSDSSFDDGLELVLLPASAIDIGLLPAPLEVGRRCHDSVPDRARVDALSAGLEADSKLSGAWAGL